MLANYMYLTGSNLSSLIPCVVSPFLSCFSEETQIQVSSLDLAANNPSWSDTYKRQTADRRDNIFNCSFRLYTGDCGDRNELKWNIIHLYNVNDLQCHWWHCQKYLCTWTSRHAWGISFIFSGCKKCSAHHLSHKSLLKLNGKKKTNIT